MLPPERLALAYFAYLAVAACAIRMPPRARLGIVAECAGAAAIVIVVARLQSASALTPWARYVREWMPLIYLLWFYWIPAHFTSPLNLEAEQWLADVDRRWALPIVGAVERAPRWCGGLLELSYLLCYPLLPAGLLVILWWDEIADPVRYTSAVLLAGALSYGVLPWLQTRPPRHREDAPVIASPSRLRRLNEAVLHRASVQLNTFPSGHVATATAAAFAVVSQAGVVGVPFAILAVSIAVACVAGRYHYVADVVLGAVVGTVGFLAANYI